MKLKKVSLSLINIDFNKLVPYFEFIYSRIVLYVKNKIMVLQFSLFTIEIYKYATTDIQFNVVKIFVDADEKTKNIFNIKLNIGIWLFEFTVWINGNYYTLNFYSKKTKAKLSEAHKRIKNFLQEE